MAKAKYLMKHAVMKCNNIIYLANKIEPPRSHVGQHAKDQYTNNRNGLVLGGHRYQVVVLYCVFAKFCLLFCVYF